MILLSNGFLILVHSRFLFPSTVVADLELQRPKRLTTFGSVLTMPPNSEIQLKANIDDAQFKLNNPATSAGRNLINVTESGMVSSGDQIGFASVMVCVCVCVLAMFAGPWEKVLLECDVP